MHTYHKAVFPQSAYIKAKNESVCSFMFEPTEAQGEAMAIGLDVAEHLEQFRALRSWHYSTAMQFRRLAGELMHKGIERHAAERYNLHADFNLRMVQVLNVLFPIGDTAEQDTSR